MSSASTRTLPLQRHMRTAREAVQAHYMPALFIGLSYMAITTMWTLYSAYVPVMLQVDFGLRATAIGLVMMLDNLLALLVQPWIGARSDRLRSRWGKRLPFIVAGMPLAAVGFALIPLAGDFFRLALDLRCQIELRLGLLVKARFAAGFEIGDPLARFLVVKQGPGRGGGQGGGNPESQGQAAQHDQNAPRPSGAR